MITVLAWFAIVVGLSAILFFIVSQITAWKRYTRDKRLVDDLHRSIQQGEPQWPIHEIREKIGTISISTCIADPTVEEKMYTVLDWLASQGKRVETQKQACLRREAVTLDKEERILLRHLIMNTSPTVASFGLMRAFRARLVEFDPLAQQLRRFVTGPSPSALQSIPVPTEAPADIVRGLQAVKQQRSNLKRASR